VTGNGNGTQHTATVSLTVTATPTFTLTASPASVSVVQGNQGTSTITTTVSGGFNSAISLSASGAPSGTTVSFNPSTIAAPGAGNSTMTITVGAGTAVGTYPITVTGNAGGTQDPATVNLTVTGTPTFTLSASPASTSFGNVMLGSSSTLPVILTNTGTGSVTISQDSVTGSGFSISGPALPFTLAAGQNMDFSLTFAPTAIGSVTGNASVLSNATNSPSNEPLSGTGIHAVSLSWTASTSTVAGYNVYRGGQSGGPYTLLNSALLGGETYVDSTAQAGQTYFYVTTAVNSADVESQYSNQVQAAVPSP
jgi:Abnormal spindle-like microcephaly-assoc'd, ASPM-SPD-2-Hydin